MNDAVTLDCQRIGRSGKARLTARLPDGTTYTDKFDLFDRKDRDRFAAGLCRGRP